MLSTLLTLGKQVSSEQDEWDNLVENPKFEEKTKGGIPITNYVLVITLDIDKETLDISNNGLRAFDSEKSKKRYRNINSELWGRRGHPWMVTCSYPKKINILRKSIFGTPNDAKKSGLFLESILQSFPEAAESLFCNALKSCYTLKDKQIDSNGTTVADCFNDTEHISKQISLSKNHKVVMLSLAIKDASLGLTEPTLLCDLEGYDFYVQKRFGKTGNQDNARESLCYITGQKSNDAISPDFSDREDLNKLFVKTTINYANNFNKSLYNNNYQLDSENRDFLQISSNYIRGKLNNKRCSVRIANVEHYIIPVFLDSANVDIKGELDYLQEMSEWVFSTRKLENLFTALEVETELGFYCVNYIAYESDGNSVKVTNHIKDVSNTWLNHIIEENKNQSDFISKYIGQNYYYNLSSISTAIPVRKEHEKTNVALKLLSQILEQLPINREQLFSHFVELILCHYYQRHKSYTNIYEYENFDKAVFDSVTKYLYTFNLLKSLNLIDMEENKLGNNKTSEFEENSNKIEQFFSEMGYSQQQQSLYWLGRMVNTIGRAQFNKNHKNKPVLNKINYNGMDYSKIKQLFVDVFELANHYNVVDNINFSSKQFTEKFPADEDMWQLTPQESVFYILSGYSLFL